MFVISIIMHKMHLRHAAPSYDTVYDTGTKALTSLRQSACTVHGIQF
jgi:hypothetical protein